MNTYNEQKTELKTWLSHAPIAQSGNPLLQGFFVPVMDGELYICANCSARIHARGLSLPNAIPVYKDEPRGVCCHCE